MNDFDSCDDFEGTETDVFNEDRGAMEMKGLKTLCLTKNETLYLDDQLTLMIDGTVEALRPVAATGGVAAPMNLIDRVGFAVLWVTDPDNLDSQGTISVSRLDLYQLREIARGDAVVGDEHVGLNLKRKIYQLLLGGVYQRDKATGRLLSSLPDELFADLSGISCSEGTDLGSESR